MAAELVTGLVLAGGQGHRMGGRDKGLLPCHGQPLVKHVIDRLAPQVASLLISANRHADEYAAFGWPVLADAHPGFAGPLAGIHAGLRACAGDWLVSAPCDSPRLPTNLVARLTDAVAGDRADIAVARTGGRLQPVFLLCRRTLADDLEAYLAGGGRRIETWLTDRRAAIADFPDALAFANINTPAELATFQP